MSVIEMIAVLCGLACVGLLIWRSILSWPIGLVQVLLYIWIFWQARLYSDVVLHVVYVALQLYGWWAWTRGNQRSDSDEMPILVLGPRGMAITVAVVALGTLTLGWIMGRFTDAALPLPDAFTTSASLVAQVLLTRKILQNWWLWIAVDLAAIPIYISRELYLTSGLYAVFLCLAVGGAIAWHNVVKRRGTITSTPAAALPEATA